MNEICQKYHISRKTVHFYIQRDLLHPLKEDNNYYRFSSENEEELKLVLRMRKAGISIEGIQDMLKYPSCANFFLFRQRVQLKKGMAEQKCAVENIERIFDEIPPNSTPSNIMAIEERELHAAKAVFDEIDARLTARMTAIFLFTPFMAQEVDDYRQFIWEKIVNITKRELGEVLPALMEHMAGLSTETVVTLSNQLAYRFISVMNDEIEKNVEYLAGALHRLCTDENMQRIWIRAYDSFIIPVRNIYQKCHKTLIHEYTATYARCMEKVEMVLHKCGQRIDEEQMHVLLEATDNRLDLLDGPVNDLFVLFCMEDSVFLSPEII